MLALRFAPAHSDHQLKFARAVGYVVVKGRYSDSTYSVAVLGMSTGLGMSLPMYPTPDYKGAECFSLGDYEEYLGI